MPKTQTYSMPITLRLSPTMMAVVETSAKEKGLSVVDYIRSAIAFDFWERKWLEAYLDKTIGQRPVDYLVDLEELETEKTENGSARARITMERPIDMSKRRSAHKATNV